MGKKILVPVDGGPAAYAGLREAVNLAIGSRESTIRVLHVLEPPPALQGMEVLITDMLLRNMTEFGEKILKNAKAIVEQHGVRAEAVFRKRPLRQAADAIEREVRRWNADVIVMGTHGRSGISRAVLGSDAESVVRASTVPVVLVRPGKDSAIRVPKASRAQA